MPLLPATLENGLRDVFEGMPSYPADAAAAGSAWAAAYRSYAAGALAGAVPALPASLPGAEAVLAGRLAGAFAAEQAPATLAAALDTAFVGFWLGPPPIGFSAPPITGAVTVALPGVLTGTLSTIFALGVLDARAAAEQAQALAGALDSWTRSVQATNATPGGPVIVPLV
jgi:hypothetical protein